MPAVFVHGNPESADIWTELFAHLQRKDVVALSPPGFGAPLPEGFDASADAYLRWLTQALQQIESPIDLVGHDWGGLHVLRVAMERPDLIRSWITDIAGCMDDEYEWHSMAQVWQTPGAGEDAVARMVNAPTAARAERLASLGLGRAAQAVADACNADMGRSILALYRSGAQPILRRWGRELHRASVRPGLVIVATEDQYTGGETLARRSAARAGARISVLHGRGHWWMCEAPAEGAAVLDEFFSALG